MTDRLKWLTARECQILVHLMDGKDVQEVAVAEFISIATTRSHVRSILVKLGVNTQHGAVAYAYQATHHRHTPVDRHLVKV